MSLLHPTSGLNHWNLHHFHPKFSVSSFEYFFTMAFNAHVVRGMLRTTSRKYLWIFELFFAGERRENISHGFTFLIFFFTIIKGQKKIYAGVCEAVRGLKLTVFQLLIHIVVCMLMLISSSSFNLLSSSCLLSYLYYVSVNEEIPFSALLLHKYWHLTLLTIFRDKLWGDMSHVVVDVKFINMWQLIIMCVVDYDWSKIFGHGVIDTWKLRHIMVDGW